MFDDQQVMQLIKDESVLIDKGAIGELYETALKFVGVGVGGILYTAGKKGGLRGAQLLNARLKLTGDDLFAAAILAFNTSGWGRATLVREGEKLCVQIENSALADSVRGQRKPICYPLAGYMAGFVEEAWGRGARVREVECVASGNARCVFEIE